MCEKFEMTEGRLTPGYLDVRKSLRGRYRGFVMVDKDTSLLQTSTSYDTPSDAIQALREGFLIIAWDIAATHLPIAQSGE